MIRPAQAADLRFLRETAEAAYAPYVARMGRRPAPMDQDFVADIAAGRVWVLPGEGFVVAFAKDGWHIENVAARRPGRGVGRRLIAFAEAEGRRRGHRRVWLYTNAAMTENLGLYPRLGYRETGRAVESGFHRVFFEKRV